MNKGKGKKVTGRIAPRKKMPLGLARLKKLADHLDHGDLGHKKFDFGNYNATEYDLKPEPYKCGTSGCAIGECPFVFPKAWKFGASSIPTTEEFKDDTFCASNSARAFFRIDSDECDHLFYPNCQDTIRYGGQILSYEATRQEVAANIYAFIEKKLGAGNPVGDKGDGNG